MKKRSLLIVVTAVATVSVFAALLMLLVSARVQAEAQAALHSGGLDSTVRLQQTYTPVLTITSPGANDILTTTHMPTYVVQVGYGLGTLVVTDSALLKVVSVTVNSGVTYHEANFSSALGYYVYTWTLPTSEDYVTHTFGARAENMGNNIGVAEWVTAYVDTVPPHQATISVPTYTESSTFTVSWSAGDGYPSLVKYDVRYRRDDEVTWTHWLTSTGETSRVFTVTSSQAISDGHYYDFRMKAWDGGDNSSGWTTATIRVGRYKVNLPAVVRNYPPVWRQADGLAGVKVWDIAVCPELPNLQYAGTEKGLYHSADAGQSWSLWALSDLADDGLDITPVVIKPGSGCTETFVSVWQRGVFHVVGQSPPSSFNRHLGEEYVYGLAIGTEQEATLYAGTNEKGMYRTGTSSDDWVETNNGISSSDRRIRSTYLISDTLFAGSRECRYYESSNDGESWSSHTVLDGGRGGNCEDAQVWAIAEVNSVLYAGLGLGKGLHRLYGESWAPVSGFLTNTIKAYGLLAHNSTLYVGTFGDGVYFCASDGTCRSLPNSGLGEPYVRGLAIAELPNAPPRLLAASNSGIWWLSLVD